MCKFKTAYILLGSLIVVLTFFCIFQIIGVTQETYLTQRYQKEINTVTRDANSPFTGEGKLSLREVEELVREKDFVESGPVSYVEVLATEVVVR